MFYFKWALSTIFGALNQDEYNAEWDKALTRLISEHGEVAVMDDGGYAIKLGDVTVWVANEYYSYGHIYMRHDDVKHRPSVRTMCKLDKIVQRIRREKKADIDKTVSEWYKGM